jgi:hypothetical protein
MLLFAAIMLALTLIAWPRLLSGAHGEKEPLLVLPRGIVLLISALPPPPIAKEPVLPSRASIRGGQTVRVAAIQPVKNSVQRY